MTSMGIKVRFKSELIIAERLYEKDIFFRYEQILTIGYKKFAPDFTIKRHDGKIIYWEHCGLTDDRRYMAHHMKKLESYYEAGIVPWKNLIVTCDDDDGALNIEIIKSEIRNKLLKGI